MTETLHDVIIVGGRCAGAALAAHLGRADLRVLVLERARLPSYPAVSTPFLLPHGMALLDELDLDPADYASGAPWLDEVVLEFGPHFEVRLPLPEVAGRRRFVVLDRRDFDDALWRHLDRHPSVERRDAFTVTGLLRDADGRVVGVRGRGEAGEETLRARAVIGADGRFSRVAREAGAAVVHARDDVPTHIYYAFWEGVAPYAAGAAPVAHIHAGLDGWSLVFMPMSRGRVSVVVQARSDRFEAEPGPPAEIYARALERYPAARRRLDGATRVSDIHGFKRMGNLFREAAGPGWALVGDAWHQKDSIDAQGIYDALYGARALARALVDWHRGACDWPTATARYAAEATAHCRPMFDATMARVKREIYATPPPLIARTVLRWLLTHPEYARRFGEVVVRTRDPATLLTPGLVARALGRGLLGRAG